MSAATLASALRSGGDNTNYVDSTGRLTSGRIGVVPGGGLGSRCVQASARSMMPSAATHWAERSRAVRRAFVTPVGQR